MKLCLVYALYILFSTSRCQLEDDAALLARYNLAERALDPPISTVEVNNDMGIAQLQISELVLLRQARRTSTVRTTLRTRKRTSARSTLTSSAATNRSIQRSTAPPSRTSPTEVLRPNRSTSISARATSTTTSRSSRLAPISRTSISGGVSTGTSKTTPLSSSTSRASSASTSRNASLSPSTSKSASFDGASTSATKTTPSDVGASSSIRQTPSSTTGNLTSPTTTASTRTVTVTATVPLTMTSITTSTTTITVTGTSTKSTVSPACPVVPASATLCPSSDTKTVAVAYDTRCYGVLCNTALVGTTLDANSTVTTSLRACVAYCSNFNAAKPFGCLGVNYIKDGTKDFKNNNCLLFGNITGQVTSKTSVDAVRLIYKGYPAVQSGAFSG